MAGSAPTISPVLNFYRLPFERIYYEQCSDTESFNQIGPELDNFIMTRASRNSPDNLLYRKVFTGQATPDEAKRVFLEFMDNGLNCHQTAVAKRADAIAQSVQYANDPASTLAAWSSFRTEFFVHIERIERLSTAELLGHSFRGDNAWQLNTEATAKIWRATILADLLASAVLAEVVNKLTQMPISAPEYAMIRAQRDIIVNLRGLIAKLNHSTTPTQEMNTGDVLNDISVLEEAVKKARNPVSWAQLISSGLHHFSDSFKKGFELNVKTDNVPVLAHDRPNLVMEALDKIIVVAAREGIPVNISWDGSKGALVIESNNSLRTLRSDRSFTDLVSSIGGRWDSPGLFDWISHVVKYRAFPPNRIIIPLKVISSTQDGGNSGGSPLPGSGFSTASPTIEISRLPSNAARYAETDGEIGPLSEVLTDEAPEDETQDYTQYEDADMVSGLCFADLYYEPYLAFAP